ncbi:hypothetical protein [Paenibacillus sp. S150]|uniref:hypothetical protein n=1 Tax=Paenibacillus sp. S150 TaxID=2749826 RepID=UPI001C594698|nr:hypothetical protein [Paenibacillus sp. S150]MBW4080871.1 hypothetical protein [Paenibacillus sp. S150]
MSGFLHSLSPWSLSGLGYGLKRLHGDRTRLAEYDYVWYFGCTRLISAIISHDRYLRSYARRLLPLPAVQSVLSPLLLCWVLLLIQRRIEE